MRTAVMKDDDPGNSPPQAELTPEEQVLPFAKRKLPPITDARARAQTKLTDATAHLILVSLFNGAYRETAAYYAKVSPDTLATWLKREDEPYRTFRSWVEEAESAFEMRALNAVTGKFNEKPELAVTMLERKFPQRWAKVVAQPPTNVNVNFSVTGALAQIEKRATQFRDPRPPLDGHATVLDVLRAPVREPVRELPPSAEPPTEGERATLAESPPGGVRAASNESPAIECASQEESTVSIERDAADQMSPASVERAVAQELPVPRMRRQLPNVRLPDLSFLNGGPHARKS